MKQACRAIVLFASVLVVGGCAPQPPVSVYDGGPVTFNNQVVRLLQRHCQVCHRPGEVAPFGLTAYQDAYSRRQKILAAVQKRKMPPWKAVPGHSDFTDVRRLSDAEIDLVARWVAAGAPEGDPRDLPAARKFSTGWALGRPGAVLAMEEPFTVPAETKDIYRCFTIPIRLGAEWQFIRAAEVLPGNRKIVHHVLTFLDTTGVSVELDRREPGPGYTCFGGPGFNSAGGIGGWAPGSVPLEIPSGVAWGIAPGARLVMQVHYHNPGPTAETDRTSIGVHFARRPLDRALRLIWPRAGGFTIPAGATRHIVRAAASVPATDHFEAIAIGAHMHLLGREVRVTAYLPDGTKRSLLYIDDWDFGWQIRYTFKKPVPLPGGTVVEVECIYDNSAANRRNPNAPPRNVSWGFQTTDEMCSAFINGVVSLPRPIVSRDVFGASPPGLDWLTRLDPRALSRIQSPERMSKWGARSRSVAIMYVTSWRSRSEVFPLTWAQIDWAGGFVRLEPGTTKNRDGRAFPLVPELRAVLERCLEYARRSERAQGRIIPQVFHRAGRALRSMAKSWRSAIKAAGWRATRPSRSIGGTPS